MRAGTRATLSFVVRDAQSAVQRVEYSLDASRWKVVYPKDGIADSRREEFEVVVDEGEAAGNVIIRATDAMNNVATALAPSPFSPPVRLLGSVFAFDRGVRQQPHEADGDRRAARLGRLELGARHSVQDVRVVVVVVRW